MKKRTFLSLIFIFGLGTALMAQEGFKIGLRFSPNIAWATIIESDDKDRVDLGQKSSVGYGYGLMINYGFTENYAINTGAHIVNRSFESVDTLNNAVATRYTAVEIPLGFKLRSNEIGSGVHVRGLFGITLDLNTGYKQSVTQASGDVAISRNTDRANIFSTSFIFGGGVEIEQDFGTFDIGLTAHRGLMNVNNRTNGFKDLIVRLNYVSLDLGYYF